MPGVLESDIRWWPVRNTSSEDVPPYGIMRATGSETKNGRTVYTIAKPNTTFGRFNYLINGPFVIKAGKYGSGTQDTAYALCSSSASPVLEQSWGVKPDEWKLFQHRPGFYMLGNYQGEGEEQRAIVKPFEVTELWGTLDGAFAQGSSATMSIFFRDGATWTDSSMNVTVYDRLLKTGATDIASGKWAVAQWYCDRWWAHAAECN